MKGLIVPETTEDFTADPVELFFDLALVFAFSQLVWHLVHFPTWTGAYEAAILFVVIWLVWSTFTWAANAVSGNARPVRAIFLVATAASVPMGASVTTAFGSGGGMFAIGASFIVVMGLGLQLWALSGDGLSAAHFQSVVRYGLPNLVAAGFLIIDRFSTRVHGRCCGCSSSPRSWSPWSWPGAATGLFDPATSPNGTA